MSSIHSEFKNKNEESFEWLTNFKSLAPYLNPYQLFSDAMTTTTTTTTSSTTTTVTKTVTKTNSSDSSSIPFSKRVLHIGCGTSTLGIELHRTFPDCYQYVLNVDNDVEIVRQMSNRWNNLLQTYNPKTNPSLNHYPADELQSCCSFEVMDVNDYHHYDNNNDNDDDDDDELPSPNTFDLILDKSTLDCLLCSHNGTCGLLSSIHHHLKPGGIYFLVTFHPVDFILPLIRDCPGMEWGDIRYYAVQRNVDSPQVLKSLEESLYQHDVESLDLERIHINNNNDDDDASRKNMDLTTSSWSSGTFEPNDNYRKYVTVFLCTRRTREQNDESISSNIPLNSHLVTKHVQHCNNLYFQQNNPLVTQMRQEELRQKFTQELYVVHSIQSFKRQQYKEGEEDDQRLILPLDRAYHVLFTEYERDEYTFDDFVVDWNSYQENNRNSVVTQYDNGMCYETALDFLKTMQ